MRAKYQALVIIGDGGFLFVVYECMMRTICSTKLSETILHGRRSPPRGRRMEALNNPSMQAKLNKRIE